MGKEILDVHSKMEVTNIPPKKGSLHLKIDEGNLRNHPPSAISDSAEFNSGLK